MFHRYSSKAPIVPPSKKSFKGLKMDEISFDIYSGSPMSDSSPGRISGTARHHPRARNGPVVCCFGRPRRVGRPRHCPAYRWSSEGRVTLVPFLVLVGTFEINFFIHTGVERIGRYIQVFYEERAGAIGWETIAMKYGAKFPSGLDPLFSIIFAAAPSLNFFTSIAVAQRRPGWIALSLARASRLRLQNRLCEEAARHRNARSISIASRKSAIQVIGFARQNYSRRGQTTTPTKV